MQRRIRTNLIMVACPRAVLWRTSSTVVFYAASGRLYVSTPPGVQVLSPEGKYVGLIPTPRNAISVAFSGVGKKTLYVVGSGALGPDGKEFTTPEGVRNNAKSIYRILMVAEGFQGRAK